MKRRVFLKNTAMAACASSAIQLFLPTTTSGMSSKKSTLIPNKLSRKATREEIRSAEYLRRVETGIFLTKQSTLTQSEV